ncbi:MAG: histidinol-phosphatase [Pseudomonadota bacterium]
MPEQSHLPEYPAVSLSDSELEEYTNFLHTLVDISGEVIRPYFRSTMTVENKAQKQAYDPVTEADQGAETAIREKIHSAYPRHGVYGEEHGYEAGDSGLIWVIDPIDGTRAFVAGLPVWGTLIGLYNGEHAVLGVMDQPYTRERFIGSRLGGQFTGPENQTILSSSSCTELAQASLCSTHPELFQTEREKAAFQSLTGKVQSVRYGGDCYFYSLLAYGLVDLVVESGLAPYDIVALIPIIESAGGIVTTWDGLPGHNGGQILAASTPELHSQAMQVLAN